MQQRSTRNKQWYAWLIVAGVMTALSCKKTETIRFDRLSENSILEYRVTNAADTIYGAIDNVKNTITVYIPYYLGIDYVIPGIKISNGARLLDDKGTVINIDGGVAPVPVDTTGYTYTVQGRDSVKRRYTLVLEIAPHPDDLKAGYYLKDGKVKYDSVLERVVNSRVPVYGNFGSTSVNARFTLTNRATGKVYNDRMKAYEIVPGVDYYTMTTDVSADIDSGYYNVEMKHQGRTTQLPVLHLVYKKPGFVNLKSTASYAPGDTVVFTAKGQSIYDTENGLILGLEKVYMKFWKAGFNFGGAYPAGFPESLFGQQIEMRIVSMSRTAVKVIFPDLPSAAVGAYTYAGFTFDFPGIGFYFDFNNETGWGKNNVLATTGRYFNITAKP
jgi:hypothetical protein